MLATIGMTIMILLGYISDTSLACHTPQYRKKRGVWHARLI